MTIMAKLRNDDHGPYVISGGYTFRPQMARYSYPTIANNYGRGIETRIVNVTEVKARHLGGTPFCKVKADDIEEIWNSHGTEKGAWDPCDKDGQ